jgi:hypothetical protein
LYSEVEQVLRWRFTADRNIKTKMKIAEVMLAGELVLDIEAPVFCKKESKIPSELQSVELKGRTL